MRRPLIRPVTALAWAIAAGILPLAAAQPGEPHPTLSLQAQEQARALQPLRVAQAEAHLQALRPELGLGSRDAFITRSAFTNTQGQAIVRLDHTYDGYRVVGSQAIVHGLAQGELRTLTPSLQRGITLTGEPRLSPQGAVAIAVNHLAPKGVMKDAPRVARVVFPAQLVGGLAFTQDPATGRQVLDRKLLVHARPSAPHVWAYEVRTRLANRVDGAKELTYYIDGTTGVILRVNDELQRSRAQAPAVPTITPVVGSGHGFYRGIVPINTTLMLDGTYALWDTTRGVQPNPQLTDFTPDGSGWAPTGMQAWYAEHDGDGAMTFNMYLFQGNGTSTWGDGQVWNRVTGTETSANGQTAAVDALSAMATTWDFYLNVFGRRGMDGLNTSVFAQVHMNGGYMDGYTDNASWSNWSQSMDLGRGSYPGNPNGLLELTDLDVVAHEMTHGITGSTVQFVNAAGLEEAGMSEGTSDFFSQMVKVYANRASGASASVIPGSGADWQIGQNVGHGTPIRWLDKPSRDGRSAEAWYDGVRYLDGHYSAGVMNRVLYLLAHGASATPGADSYSPYLPGGFAGVGLDAAARIWFKAVTEYLHSNGTGDLTFMTAREAALQAATALYGATSANTHAVENAFSAINVGLAPGQSPRTEVRFADWRQGDYVETSHSTGWANKEFFPQGETLTPRITVLNNANTGVTWSIGGPSIYNGAESYVGKGGRINADGTWTAPQEKGWFALTATSKADPAQFAEGRAFLINLDADQDLEQDAVDMGTLAFSWYLSNGLSLAHSVFNAPWVDDGDVGAFIDAFQNTWLPK